METQPDEEPPPEEKKGGKTIEEVREYIRSSILSDSGLPADTLEEEMNDFTESQLRDYANALREFEPH